MNDERGVAAAIVLFPMFAAVVFMFVNGAMWQLDRQVATAAADRASQAGCPPRVVGGGDAQRRRRADGSGWDRGRRRRHLAWRRADHGVSVRQVARPALWHDGQRERDVGDADRGARLTVMRRLARLLRSIGRRSPRRSRRGRADCHRPPRLRCGAVVLLRRSSRHGTRGGDARRGGRRPCCVDGA